MPSFYSSFISLKPGILYSTVWTILLLDPFKHDLLIFDDYGTFYKWKCTLLLVGFLVKSSCRLILLVLIVKGSDFINEQYFVWLTNFSLLLSRIWAFLKILCEKALFLFLYRLCLLGFKEFLSLLPNKFVSSWWFSDSFEGNLVISCVFLLS